MGEIGYVPFGEWRPDLKYLVNDGLLDARNVVPVYGNYITAPVAAPIVTLPNAANIGVYGIHTATYNKKSYVPIVTLTTSVGDILEVDDIGTVTNRTRTAAGNYAIVMGLFSGCSFGSNIILPIWPRFSVPTTPVEPTQYLAPGAARLDNLITSTFAPIGKFAFPFGPNLFLAHCHLPAAYDGLASGLNNTLVAWSANKNIRQFGSSNANPEIAGAGYQPITFDMGEITGAVACDDFAIIAMEDGLVRVDGPPYTFHPLARHHGIRSASAGAICAAGSDVYYFSPSGLVRIRDGQGVPELVGMGKFARWLIDNTTGFSSHAVANGVNVQMQYDPVNDLVCMLYTYEALGNFRAMLIYNVREDRASYWVFPSSGVAPLWIGSGVSTAANWLPARDIRFVNGDSQYGRFAHGEFGDNATIHRGYMQFKPDRSTRVLRVRPIYNVSDQAAIEQITVTVESTSKPYATPTVKGPYTTSGHPTGWIVTPDTIFADFHSLKFEVTTNGNMHQIMEYEGFEYEIDPDGPVFAS